MANQTQDNSYSKTKLAVLFVILSCFAAVIGSLTYSAREFLNSGKAIPIIEVANEYFKLGNIKYYEKDYEGAILAYQDALRLYPGMTIHSRTHTHSLSYYLYIIRVFICMVESWDIIARYGKPRSGSGCL
jgi:tetratricopeptide (TPR) repeat protein